MTTLEPVTCGEFLTYLAQSRKDFSLGHALLRVPDTKMSSGWGWLKTVTVNGNKTIILNEMSKTDKPFVPRHLYADKEWSDYQFANQQSADVSVRELELLLRSGNVSRTAPIWYCDDGTYYPVTQYRIHDSFNIRLGSHFPNQPAMTSAVY